MAKDLSLQEGIGSSPDYLNGNLVDDQTLVGSGINQDMVQFFQKLMALAEFTANGSFDNETNGYQFVDALLKNVGQRNIVSSAGASDFEWLTFAKLDGATKKASAKFTVITEEGAFHFLLTHYNGVNNLSVLNHGASGVTNSLKFIRVKSAASGDGALIQMYLRSVTNVVVVMYDNDEGSGWELVTPTNSEPIAGLSEKRRIIIDGLNGKQAINIANNDEVILGEILPRGDNSFPEYGSFDIALTNKGNIYKNCFFSIAIDKIDALGAPASFNIVNDYSRFTFFESVRLKQFINGVTTVSDQGNNIFRYTFDSSQNVDDLSEGDDIYMSDFDDQENDGRFRITSVNTNYIEVFNENGVDASGQTGYARHKLYLCLKKVSSDSENFDVSIESKAGAAFKFITNNTESLLNASTKDGSFSLRKHFLDLYLRKEITLDAGFTGNVYYMQESNGIIHVWGTVDCSGNEVNIGTLPSGYRPRYELNFAGIDEKNTENNGVQIDTSGVISVVLAQTGGVLLSFSVRYSIND